jgi:hypothetical protein
LGRAGGIFTRIDEQAYDIDLTAIALRPCSRIGV